MVTIRPRTENDIAECVSTLHLVYDDNGYPINGVDNAYQFLTGGAIKHAWVAELDGQIIGHITVSEATTSDVSVVLWRQIHPNDKGKLAVLGRLFVHPQGRGGGVAAGLINTALKHAKQTGERLILFSLIKDQAAIQLYEKLGWEQFGTTTFKYGNGEHMEAICFASPLDR